MNWLQIVVPLIIVIIAYIGGKAAGRKEAELKQKLKELKQSENTDEIISNNSNLTDSDFNSWVQKRNKK